MKNCPNCNANVSDTAKFCVSCGFNIREHEEKLNKEYFCAECGTKFSGGTFCPECGYNVANDIGVETKTQAQKEDETTLLLSEVNGNLSELNRLASVQLFESEGLTVENGVLMGYTGKKRSVVIHDVEEIYDSAFENNEIITYVEINEGVKIIGRKAFASCPSLVEINIPSSCKKLYEDTFENDNLEHVTFAQRNDDAIFSMISEDIKNYLNKDEINEFIKEENGKVLVNIKGMADFALEKQKAEEEIKNTYEIENGVLVKCKIDLAKAKIPNGVVKIGNEAFKACENLTVVEIPDSVVSIGNEVFYLCTSLSKIILPNSVTSIGNYAFYCCTNLTSIEIPNSVTTIGDYAFQSCTNLTSIEIPSSVTTISNCAFQNCTNLTSIEIPSGVTTIGFCAFYGCTSLTSIKIPSGVTTIGNNAFDGCTNLTSIEIPSGVTTIGDYAFQNCTNLTSIEIPNSVKSIGDCAFQYCTNLKTIKMSRYCTCGCWWKDDCPATVTYID